MIGAVLETLAFLFFIFGFFHCTLDIQFDRLGAEVGVHIYCLAENAHARSVVGNFHGYYFAAFHRAFRVGWRGAAARSADVADNQRQSAVVLYVKLEFGFGVLRMSAEIVCHFVDAQVHTRNWLPLLRLCVCRAQH